MKKNIDFSLENFENAIICTWFSGMFAISVFARSAHFRTTVLATIQSDLIINIVVYLIKSSLSSEILLILFFSRQWRQCK